MPCHIASARVHSSAITDGRCGTDTLVCAAEARDDEPVSHITRSDVAGHATPRHHGCTFSPKGEGRHAQNTLLDWLGDSLCNPIAAGAEIYLMKDLPDLNPWKLGLLAGAVLLVIFSRNRDEVLKHKLV